MGSIKDLTDLVTQYIDSVDDRKFAAELREIQKMIIAIQREQSVLQEKNGKLQSENIKLKEKLASLASAGDETQGSNPQKAGAPSDLMLEVLHYCSEYQEGVSATMVQQKFNHTIAKAELQLSKLQDAGLIDYGSLVTGQDIQYVPTKNGLELLDENGLI